MEGVNVSRDLAEHTVVWVATRKAIDIAEAALGPRLLSSHLLHDLLHLKSTLPELHQAALVATELPANVESGYEQSVLAFAVRVLKQCPHLLMLVQPSLRRRSNRSIWVSRWNQTRGFKPFEFVQTCSCLVGDGVPGCHVATFVGTTENLQLESCSAVPSTDVTVQSSNDSLLCLLRFFCNQIALLRPLG